jgi:hypothetical protein
LFGSRLLLPHFRPSPPLLLPLGRLPAANQPLAFWIAAIPLIPAAGMKDPPTSLAQANPPAAGGWRPA